MKNYGQYREGCIRLDEAKYFNHNIGTQADINNQYADILNYWMRQPCPMKDANGRTNWRYMRDFWNNSPFEKKIKRTDIPDYSKLNYNY